MKSRLIVIILALSSVTGAAWQMRASDPARVAAMHENWRAGTEMLLAVIRGDLDAVKGPAQRLADSAVPAGLPDALTRHALAMNSAGREAAGAANATAAANAAGQLLATCGACHLAAGTRPAVTSRDWPSVRGTVGHMLEHQRAVEQLMRGLMIPSSAEWQAGARALRAAPLHARELPRDARLTPALLRVEEAVHQLAEEAVAAESAQSRTRVFSTLLARCADCHSLHRRIWGPG